jgi:RIP metalloprotease RseP
MMLLRRCATQAAAIGEPRSAARTLLKISLTDIPLTDEGRAGAKLPFPEAFKESVRRNAKGALMIVEFLKGMLQRRMSPKNLSGPIGIGQMAGSAAREGPATFFMLMSMVSLNLAIFNLLPIPILDGGVILMLPSRC